MTLVRDVVCDAKTGQTTERMIDVPQASFDVPATVATIAEQSDANARTIEQQAEQALAANTAYIAIVSPTNAQVAAQVKALTRQNNKLIRLLLRKLDGTD